MKRALLYRLYVVDGLSAQAIAKKLESSVSTITRNLHASGIPVRGRGPQRGKHNHGWKGGRIVDAAGYVRLYMPDYPGADSVGYIPEHRFVMEQELGRRLAKGELVHHKNRNKQDNNAENLQVVSVGEHRILHSTALPPIDVLRKWYVDEKMTLNEIAEIVGCYCSTVGNRLRRHGVQIRKSNDLRKVWFPDDLAEQYQTKSLRELAREHSCSVAAVRDALTRLGVPMRKSRKRDSHGVLLRPQPTSTPDE